MLDIVILAAGQGTRMRSSRPKVLHSIAGQSMLAHVLQTAFALKPARILVVIGHGADQVRAALHGQLASWKQRYPETSFDWVMQAEQRGTGHAVLQALPKLAPDGLTMVLYGDVPLMQTTTLQALRTQADAGAATKADAERGGPSLTMVTTSMADPSGYGRILRDAQGAVTGIVEQKDATVEQLAIQEVNTGFMAIPNAFLHQVLPSLQTNNAQGEYYLTDVIAMAARQGLMIRTVQPSYDWEVAGVNSRAQQQQLERQWQRYQAEQLLEQGVTLLDAERIDIRGSLRCGRDVVIDVGCIFEGEVELADGVEIGPYCVLRNCRVDTHARIAAFSHLDQSLVGDQAVVGPYARLRPGTALAQGAHVGNFVEMKNTTLGRGSKANHLSYLGDATIGDRVNIGAGTITCNYDGADKHRTVIEDDAFIGSDSQLVAPVTVERGATLGAGTTLTQDAPAEQLTLTRSPQVSIRNWRRPEKVRH